MSENILHIKESTRNIASARYTRDAIPNRSIFGIGASASYFDEISIDENDELQSIEKTTLLKEHMLLRENPSVYAVLQMIKRNEDVRNKARKCVKEDSVSGIPSKNMIFDSFNQLMKYNGISSGSISYGQFIKIIRQSGVGISIKLIGTKNILQPQFKFISRSKLYLKPAVGVLESKLIKNAFVFVFDGHLDKMSNIHELLQYVGQEKKALMIAARSFSKEVIKTIEHNNRLGKLNVHLVVPSEHPEGLHEFAIMDIAYITGSTIPDELRHSYSINYCGFLEEFSYDWNLINIRSNKENLDLLLQKIASQAKDLFEPEAVRAMNSRLENLRSNTMEVRIPIEDTPDRSHLIDDLSCMLSLWSDLLVKDHIELDGLISLPKDTLISALRFFDSVIDFYKEVRVVIKRD